MVEILTQNYSNKVREASKKIATIVGSTLGPGGRTVLVSNESRTYLSKDGITVARALKSSDSLETAIFKLIKESGERTNTTVGDSTTTTTILCHSFIDGIFDLFHNKNYQYDKVYKDFDTCLEFIYNDLQSQSRNIESEEDIAKIAFLSSNGDTEIADLVKETLVQIGVDGTLSIKESKTTKSSVEITDGYNFNSGFASQEFTNTKDYKFLSNDCIIFMYQGKLSHTKEVESLMMNLFSDGKPVIIVAEEFEQTLLSILMYNNAKNSTKLLCIEAPYIGKKRSDAIKDLSMVVGGVPLHPIHNPISNFDPKLHLGYAGTVSAGKNKTLFIKNNGDTQKLEAYINYLQECLKESLDEQEEMYLTYRINQLSSSAVTIYLGANTPAELQEKKDRLEDAIEASTVALRGGVVPACCAALLRSIQKLIEIQDKLSLNYKIIPSRIEEILNEPFNMLIENMNYSVNDIKIKILNSNNDETYDLRKNKIVNAFDDGVIEPLFANLQSIKNSYSLAKVLTSSKNAILGV